jgi:ubiquinone/menaquinone biosynthesis C-methylase UbiE
MIFSDNEWEAHKSTFSNIYDESNYSSPIQSWVMGKSHKLVEKKFNEEVFFSKVLEIGAGTGEHLQYIRHKFDEYTLSDSNKKILENAQQKLSQKPDPRINYDIQEGDRLSYKDNTFDRLIATHVLEHIHHPHNALKEWARVLKDGGTLSVVLPTDPGFAWRFGRKLGPRRSAIAKGIPYDYLMAREHVNSCVNLISILRHYFPNSNESWWPTPIPSVDVNLFFACNAKVSK